MKLRVLSERSSDNTIHVLATLIAPPQATDSRRPVNLALVIDRSSSMRGPRLEQACLAARELIGRLGPRDRLAIVVFDAAPTTMCEAGPVTEARKREMTEALERIETGVGTNLGAAIGAGADLIRTSFVRNAISRILLLTDGQASLGITSRDRLADLARKAYEHGVTTTAMGLGQGFDDDVLMSVAEAGNGGYYYLARPSDIPAAFGRELEGVFCISAQNTCLKLVPHPDIEMVELLHKLSSQTLDNGLIVHIGDVSSSSPRQVLFRMSIADDSTSKTAGTFTVTYKDGSGTPGANLSGISLSPPSTQDIHAIVGERLCLQTAHAVDAAWTKRASGNADLALLVLNEVREEVMAQRDANRCNSELAADLLEEMARAEVAVHDGLAEREGVRRGMREKSQMTKLGHSVLLHPLSPSHDDS